MPKQVIVIMQQNYPFGQCEEITNENTRVLVRKIYQVSVQQRNKLLQKVNILRKLKNEHMIKIESVLQEEESIHFLFEYIPIKLETWISNINDQFIENFRDQLIKFSSFLANNYIKIDFQLKNIGMDQNYGAKYFLDLEFQFDNSLNREKLKSMYIREITNLFKPYIISTNSTPNYALDSERTNNEFKSNAKESPQKATQQDTRKVHDTSISPPTNRPNNNTNNSSNKNKEKEKALIQYYQDVNMSVDSENEKILQEFMDVLDNEEEEEVKNHPPPPPPQMSKPQSQPQQQQRGPQFSKQPSQPASNAQAYLPHNSSFNQSPNYQQNQYQQQQQPASSRQLQPNTDYQQSSQYAPQFHSQNNISGNISGLTNQVQTARVSNNTTQSMGRGKSEIKEPPQMEMWRESADLQNRVKNAIEKSMSVIKKFKAIKENSLI